MRRLLVRLAIAADPWLGTDRGDSLPWRWQVEQRFPMWRRFPQLPAVLRGQFLLMLNIWPWPLAAWDAIRAAARYLWTGLYHGSSMPSLPRERYFRREAEIIRAVAAK